MEVCPGLQEDEIKGTGDWPIGVERGRERKSEEGDRGWAERGKELQEKERGKGRREGMGGCVGEMECSSPFGWCNIDIIHRTESLICPLFYYRPLKW